MGFVAKPEQDPLRHAALGEPAAPERQRGDPDPAPDEHGAGGVGRERRRRRERTAERAGELQALAGAQGRESRGARADRLEQEVEPDPVITRLGLGDRERARQVRPPARTAPAVRGEHVELPSLGLGSLAVEPRDDPIAAGRLVADDFALAPPERRKHPLVSGSAHEPLSSGERRAASASIPCNSCSETGSSVPSRAATIAREAAVAPVIVVMQAIPWRTAAERIS